MIHPLADVQSTSIGSDTRIWQFAIVLKEAIIGTNCNINCHTFIENDVVLGNYVTVKSGVYLWDGIRIGNHVFIGPNATFVNDTYPRSQQYPEKHIGALLEDYVSIGANATILGGITIGHHALIGAGAVVTKNVPAYALITGNPGRRTGWVDTQGKKLIDKGNGKWESENGTVATELNGQLFIA